MNFELTEQQKAIQEAARKFAQEELLPGVLERDEKSEFPVEQFHKAGELGFIGLPYPKEYGGQGLGYMEYALAVEEVSKVDASFGIAFSVTTSLYAGSVWNSDATEEQKKAFLPEVLSGKALGSFGLTEPNAGSDAGGCITTAVKDGDEYVINVLKSFNTNGPLAKFRYLQFKMAELAVKIEAAKYMLYKAATDHDTGKPYDQSAAKAKYLCTNVAMEVTEWAVQFMGGNGYMKEYHVERMFRDAKITQIYEGTNEIQQLIVGGALFR